MEITRRKRMTGSRFLSFILADEQYCIEILKIREIMGMVEITPVPQTPDFIQGVINLRGQIVPIIDLRLKFDMPFREYTNKTCIVVVELSVDETTSLMGIVVDTILEVVSIPEEKIRGISYINSKINSEFLKGIAEWDDSIMIILDITRVLTSEEFVFISEMQKGDQDEE